MIHTVMVTHEQDGQRLDDGLKALIPQLSKTEIRRVIDWGGCAINDVCVRIASRALHQGDRINLGVMEKERCVNVVYTATDLLYEDDDYLSINKASGLNSQRTPYQLQGTVEYGVACYLKSLGSPEPARVIHRLDRGTSGVMFFPKHQKAATHIGFQLKQHQVEKVYWALVAESPDDDTWEVDAVIAKLSKFRYGVALPGREAFTSFRVLARGAGATLVACYPRTGRTHQIRVHLEYGGMPIIGDTPYGGAPASRMMLHCRRMAFAARDGRPVSAEAPPDAAFVECCASHGIDLTTLTTPSPS